jgi:pyruvate kinase
VAKYRPEVPILAITTNLTTQQRLVLSWGVVSHLVSGPSPVGEMFLVGAKLTKEMGLGQTGDLVVVTGGAPVGEPGTTNLLKVQRIE